MTEHSLIFYLMSAYAGSQAFLVVMLIMIAQAVNPNPDIAIYGDLPPGAYSVGGSVMGALLSLYIYPISKDDNPAFVIRNMSLKFGSSAVVGLLFAPAIVRYLHVSSSEVILAISGILSLTGVSILHHVTPHLGKWSLTILTWVFRTKTGIDLDETEKKNEPKKD